MPRFLFSEKSITPGVSSGTEFQGDAVTPSDSADLVNGPCQAIYVSGAGNVSINLAAGGTGLLSGLSAGEIVRVNASRINATGTTATGIFALYHQRPL
jgi:hypothetical protein